MSQVKSYKVLSQELEEVIDKLQASDLDVDEIIGEYQKGVGLIDELNKYLQTAQNKIKKINAAKTKK